MATAPLLIARLYRKVRKHSRRMNPASAPERYHSLRIKCKRALEHTGYRNLVVAGGVGANRHLREVLQKAVAAQGGRVYFPALEYCTDNGAMIAYAGALRLLAGQIDDGVDDVLPRWSLESLPALGAATRGD